jgi:hypothetical protein
MKAQAKKLIAYLRRTNKAANTTTLSLDGLREIISVCISLSLNQTISAKIK